MPDNLRRVSVLCAIGVATLFTQRLVAATPIHLAAQPIVVDGHGNETGWRDVQWRALDQPWVGSMPDPDDFSGRFKLLWDAKGLYLLAEIHDDVLFDKTAEPTELYWDDDCLEIFVDADASGGIHTTNHNAFAYHVGLDNQAVDIGVDEKAHIFPHVESRWRRQRDNRILWEVAIRVYPDTYTLADHARVAPNELKSGDELGFMLAYCDNDGSQHREHFMGSWKIEPVGGDRNRGYIDASVFEKMRLVNEIVSTEGE